MAGTFTATAQNRVLNWLFTTSAPTRAATWFVALHVGANGGAGAANEIVGNGYARQAVAFTISGNVASNSGALSFGPDTTANWGTVTDITIWDLVTGGTCLAQGTVAASVAYAVGDTATVAIGALTVTLT
jgi:hypothetical protein